MLEEKTVVTEYGESRPWMINFGFLLDLQQLPSVTYNYWLGKINLRKMSFFFFSSSFLKYVHSRNAIVNNKSKGKQEIQDLGGVVE